MQVHHKSVEFAKDLIRKGRVDMDSDWSEVQPSAQDENKYLENHSWDEYGNWFLATNPGEGGREDKEYYNFPYGDFKVVHRSGVIAAKQRAAQNDYHDVRDAAGELLDMIDRLHGQEKD